MKAKLNFEVDKPTVNGRIYPKELVLREFHNKKVPVRSGKSAKSLLIGDAYVEVSKNGEIDIANILLYD
jgi:hypothetical protein